MAPNEKKFKEIKEACKQAYTGGEVDPKVLARKFRVGERTVRGWIAKGNWKTKRQQVLELESRIAEATDAAYLAALEQFIEHPEDSNLQSLVALLKSRQNATQPGREYLDYIVKFMGQMGDYMIEKGLTTLHTMFKPIVVDLAEYLRVKNA